MIPPLVAALAARTGADPEGWVNQCHGAALAIVKAGLYPGARVARGWCRGVPGQHSWVVIGDPYAPESEIVDPTLWCYADDVDDLVWMVNADGRHQPHGAGYMLDGLPPQHYGGETIRLDTTGLSASARMIVDGFGPLDVRGWMDVFNLPVGGWPAGEILDRAADEPRLKALIPMDRLGMLTDRNPGGLYLAGEEML